MSFFLLLAMWEKNPDRTVEAETEADDVAAAAVVAAAAAVGGGAVIAVIGTGVTVVSLIMMVESSLIKRVGRLLPSTAGSRPAAGIGGRG